MPLVSAQEIDVKIGILFDREKVLKLRRFAMEGKERDQREKARVLSRFVGRFLFLFLFSVFLSQKEREKSFSTFYLSLSNEFVTAMFFGFRGFELRSCNFGLLALEEEKSRWKNGGGG